MAKTVKAYSPASGTVVFTAHNASGQYWNGTAFANYSAGSIATYAIAATSLGGGWYSASIDDLATSYDLRLRVGGSLATTDPVVDAYSFDTSAINKLLFTDNGTGGFYVRGDMRAAVGSEDAAGGISASFDATGLKSTAVAGIAEGVDSVLSGTHGDGSWEGGGGGGTVGPGADPTTVRVRVGTTNIADADVWVTTDAGGGNVVAGPLRTDSDGKATFMLDTGSSYFLWAQKNGVNSIQGEPFTGE